MQKPNLYTPNRQDVFSVRRALLRFVPAELAVVIVELAEYWPTVTATREAFSGPATTPAGNCDEWCYLLSAPIPPGVKPRQITFELESVAECTYDSICSDYTSFQAAVIKPTDVSQNIMLDPIEDYPERQIHTWNVTNPQRWSIQEIPISWPEGTQSKLIWDDDHATAELKTGTNPLLPNLVPGDRVAVMVRGLIPGWINCIYNITMNVYYST